MNINSNGYVLVFAVGVCVATSLTLAVAANALRETQAAAKEFDRQKNVMIAAGLCEAGDTRPRAELEKLYQDRVEEFVIDTESGEPTDMAPLEADGKRYRVVATTKAEGGEVEAYVLPISGRGLWSTLYGYLALDGDKNHVRGITFYDHKETPGLGGEVDNPGWQAQWRGKTVLDEAGNLVSITVKKGAVDEKVEREKKHAVDGLAGATITGKGVETFVQADLKAFSKYLYKKGD